MITKIELNGVACFKSLATLATDKKVNLIYGLNGTGKSILSNFLYNKTDAAYSSCSLEGISNEEILVYNQIFIKEYFYESDNLKGIFTLSKENKEAEEKITKADNEIRKFDEEKTRKSDSINTIKSDLAQKKQNAENIIWKIKKTFTGGDRVLEFCLENLKGQKEKLFNHIADLEKPPQKPIKTTDQLKKEVEALKGENAQRYDSIPIINFAGHPVESNPLLQKEIIGNEDSTIAKLIKKLDNSDWVKKGLDYLPDEIDDVAKPCPFCQEITITKTVVDNIKDYFDEIYENDLNELTKIFTDYENEISSIQSKENYESYPFIIESKTEFDNKYSKVIKVLSDNKRKIEKKQRTPSQKITLIDSSETIKNFGLFIAEINNKIKEHNQKIDNKDDSLNKIKDMFWNIMRWDYDQTLYSFKKDSDDVQKKIGDINKEITGIDKNIESQKEIINEQQKNTVNIEEAISNINNGLVDLGIDSFKIINHSDNMYKIVRGEGDNNTFQTLSEGEKMIISFLYFCELCKGKKSAAEISNRKIIIIDDPISSLSHIYIFNIGQLIKNDFFNSANYDQVFVLTHSLYFFYELTDTNHERRKENQNLFRMIKNSDGSQILEMKYEEIQNDYHSYWHMIKDERQPPALIANCMRNIIEYFFNFVEKTDFNNVFQKSELQETKYQAFCRYMNRESHSLGQNIFDIKEFNYSDFKEALGLLFKESGYEDHYKKMIK